MLVNFRDIKQSLGKCSRVVMFQQLDAPVVLTHHTAKGKILHAQLVRDEAIDTQSECLPRTCSDPLVEYLRYEDTPAGEDSSERDRNAVLLRERADDEHNRERRNCR